MRQWRVDRSVRNLGEKQQARGFYWLDLAWDGSMICSGSGCSRGGFFQMFALSKHSPNWQYMSNIVDGHYIGMAGILDVHLAQKERETENDRSRERRTISFHLLSIWFILQFIDFRYQLPLLVYLNITLSQMYLPSDCQCCLELTRRDEAL